MPVAMPVRPWASSACRLASRSRSTRFSRSPEMARVALPEAFLARPLAHRGLHGPGVPENSLAALRAAIAAGYGVELDLQPSSDGVAMVFHDAALDRMTGRKGRVDGLTAKELGTLRLAGTGETIPTLRAFLDEVAGRVPVLVEIKSQD